MSYVITEACVDHMDQACVQVCPVDAISGEAGADRKLYIDPDTCVECGSCRAVCPNAAIYPGAQLPADQQDFAWIDAAWYRDRAVAREVLVEVLNAPSAVTS